MSIKNGAAKNNGNAGYDVCLVCMPYVRLSVPSLALGLLKSILEASGLKVKVINANLLFAQYIGLQKFNLISHEMPMALMTGEWSFSTSAFPSIKRNDDTYLQTCYSLVSNASIGYDNPGDFELLKRDFLELRKDAELFIPELAGMVLETGAKIVGCTSTFEQHTPSLALLRKLKTDAPGIVTMMGGANCESEMGVATHRNFPWVDYVVSGEADGIIADLCKNILGTNNDVPLSLLPNGVFAPVHRKTGIKPVAERIKFNNLDQLPAPDYDDYFISLKESPIGKFIRAALPLETSRGCWWGALHHCTFCGLNGNGMGFRSKSPEKVLQEIETLEAKYNISSFEVVDNILDMSYFNTLLPVLAEAPKRRNLFYEVKANLSREKILLLKQAGINWIQPGIESLHSNVLDLMDKGVKGWQNIQLLKWCREYGIRVSWSILFNFPGEEDEWYTEMEEWIPQLEHLQAPAGLIPLRYDRFSVYHTKATALGLDLQPYSAMFDVYGLPATELNELAYFFVDRGDYDPFGKAGPVHSKKTDSKQFFQFTEKVKAWRENFWQATSPILCMEEKGDTVIIFDTRSCAKQFRNVLTGLARAIVLLSDSGCSSTALNKALEHDFKLTASENELAKTITELKDWGYIIEIDGRYLNLAVQGEIPLLPGSINFPGGNLVNLTKDDLNIKVRKSSKKDFITISQNLTATFKDPLVLDSGELLPEFSLAYQTYGVLNKAATNAILVFHPFSKNAHLAGRYSAEGTETGWWDNLVGPGKPLDTNRYFIVCSNVLGGSGGSTGPASINPLTAVPYGMNFPIITIGDMVNAQKRLMEFMGVKKWSGIIGGCFGGEQALEWMIRYPEAVNSAIIISTTPATSAHTLALSKIMRNLICSDPHWNNGNYYGKTFPVNGLTQSILAALPIWMSKEAMAVKFGRRRIKDDKSLFTFEPDFEVEKFMVELAGKAQKEFDPNSLLYLSKAAEYFDLPYYYGSLEAAFERVSCPALFISYKSDWRYPPHEVNLLHTALINLGKDSKHLVIDHPFGHGAFVFDPSGFAEELRFFLQKNIPQIAVAAFEEAVS